jgi:deoxyribose-phosphate aldolase
VRTAEDAIKMAQAGANRIGASASVAIVTGATGDGDGKAVDAAGRAARAKGY